jgi:hypothetical protein
MTIDQINSIARLQRMERQLYQTITKTIPMRNIDQAKWMHEQLTTIQQHIRQQQQYCAYKQG